MDPKDIVEQGYDRIGEEYERWSAKATDSARERYLGVLWRVSPKARRFSTLDAAAVESVAVEARRRVRLNG